MIDYIKYTIDGVTYSLVNNGDETWLRDGASPRVAGNYLLTLVIGENGAETTIDSSNSLYETYLNIIVETEKYTSLKDYVPEFITKTVQFADIFNIENEELDDLYVEIEKIKSNTFISSSSTDSVARIEDFLNIKGLGTLEQRKSFLISLNQKGSKLNESTIRNIVKSIAGSDCIIAYFGSGDLGNPEPQQGLLRIQVQSPDNTKNYRYDDITRALTPLVPSHIKLLVVKYFATWQDILSHFAEWADVAAMTDWQAVNDYLPTT